MYNPDPYDDLNPINRPKLSEPTCTSIVTGTEQISQRLADDCRERLSGDADRLVLVLDGYVGAQMHGVLGHLEQRLREDSIDVTTHDVATVFRDPADLEESFQHNLPTDTGDDPVLLFGTLYRENMESLMDTARLSRLEDRLKPGTENRTTTPRKHVSLVHGHGAGVSSIRRHADLVVYFDVTPKETILRIKRRLVRNLGDDRVRPFRELMRRCYYVDFEVAGKHRAELLNSRHAHYYVANDKGDSQQMMPISSFAEICSSLVMQPFRCKPVYTEGVWGGHLTTRVRGLPQTMRNCAWVFDLIPLEVSVLVEVGSELVELPYFTFVKEVGTALMGRRSVEAFDGYFPIRFNYDDTFHSSGNMSIQLHPGDEFVRTRFGEHGRQDESYYVVATAHGAGTYIGFRDDANVEEFLGGVTRSENHGEPLEYDRYINFVRSVPGTQFILPAGTIHSSGRNQVVLEIGSLTIGSYTFKMYDYLRLDLDGKPRPIHSRYGAQELKRDRRESWVDANLVQQPRKIASGDDWAEYVVGEHDLVYFSLRRLEFTTEIMGDTGEFFHVLALVDGEHVRVEVVDDPSRSYEMAWLDIVVVPQCVGRYRIRNLGDQPVCVHKTQLRDDFERVL